MAHDAPVESDPCHYYYRLRRSLLHKVTVITTERKYLYFMAALFTKVREVFSLYL